MAKMSMATAAMTGGRHVGGPKIAIVGAGIAGLALAGMLSHVKDSARVDVFERASRDRDQGYGLDLDENGREALRRAGIFERLWEFSRPHSDVGKMCDIHGNVLLHMYVPHFFRRWWPDSARPESNRELLRDVMLQQMAAGGNATVTYNTAIQTVRLCNSSASASTSTGTGTSGNAPHGEACTPAQAMLVDGDGVERGPYDLVVDASGVHSPLRGLRVADSQGLHYTGNVLIHGVVEDPEASAPPELVAQLGQGTLFIAGRGVNLVLQRFGARPDDRRAAFFYFTSHDDPAGVHRAASLPESRSRTEGTLKSGENLERVKRWLHADMGTSVCSLYHRMVDCLDRVTVRPQYSHGNASVQREDADDRLPLVCIGDALKGVGLGGGGNMALRDAVGLLACLEPDGAFDPATGQLSREALRAAREAEAKGLQEKIAFALESDERRAVFLTRPADGASPHMSLTDMMRDMSGPRWAWLSGALAPLLTRTTHWAFGRDMRNYGYTGSAPPKPA